jgi:two-component system response regulator AlgR|tara:strand:+ start:578 stop:1303 length:726 start_codon:yes stop_codon:yes gene_type:complete
VAERPLCALVVDDEAPARRLLRMLCSDAGIVVSGEADDGDSALALLEEIPADIVFLDIAMPGIDGMETARRIPQGGNTASVPAVVFTTAFAQHALAAFDVGAVDYLLKPIDTARFGLAIERVRAALGGRLGDAPSPADHLWVPHRSDLVRVEVAAVERVEAERDYVRVVVGGRSHLLRETMEGMAKRLPSDRFIRIHRSTIVRRDLVRGLRHEGGGVWSIALADDTMLRIGRSYLDAVRSL